MFILYCESHTVQLLKNYFDKTNSEYQYQFPLGSLDFLKQKTMTIVSIWNKFLLMVSK